MDWIDGFFCELYFISFINFVDQTDSNWFQPERITLAWVVWEPIQLHLIKGQRTQQIKSTVLTINFIPVISLKGSNPGHVKALFKNQQKTNIFNN